MSFHSIVIESFDHINENGLKKNIQKGTKIYVVEPFIAYHHSHKVRFHPPHLPSFVNQYIKNGKLSVIKAEEIEAKFIYHLAAEKAVKVIEPVYPEYRKEHRDFIHYVTKVLKSSEAENLFKKMLCDKLAEFYSVNILLHRIEKRVDCNRILVYPDTNIQSYLKIKELLARSNQDYFEHSKVWFSKQKQFGGFLKNLRKYLSAIGMLSAQTIASGLSGNSSKPAQKKIYSYGISIISPRQLANNQRGPEYLIDNSKISSDEVVYFPLRILSDEQKRKLAEKDGDTFFLPKPGKYFSNFKEWKELLRLALNNKLITNAEEIEKVCRTFIYYFIWREAMKTVRIRHFITHCDFSVNHIGRNLALKQAGVQTWYYTDTVNSGCNFKSENNSMLNPLWTYLNYDHLVTWDDFYAQYIMEHPGNHMKTHIVGCIWSGHIQKKTKTGKDTSNPLFENLKDRFVLAVFDSTYGMNSLTSYSEGIIFAEHILQLADTCSDCYFFLKEKKNRDRHFIYDPDLGPKLMNLYDKMDKHPRISIYSDDKDSSKLISISDMVISFPFTSTTFEALSVDKPAIWHDPCGHYKDTPYGKIKKVTSHNYKELKAKVQEIKNLKAGTYQDPFPSGSPLMDPFRDGRAIERFRDLLTSNYVSDGT